MEVGARAPDLQPRVKAGSAEETQSPGPSRPCSRATVLFVFKKDNFSARRATVFTPNLLELFSNGRTGEQKGAWDFSWEKGWDEVTSQSVSPCSKPQVLEAGGAGNPLLLM